MNWQDYFWAPPCPEKWNIFRDMVQRKYTLEEIASVLSVDTCEWGAAYAKNTAVLEVLSAHHSFVVRATVAGNPYTPEHILNELIRDPHNLVRAELVGNRAATPEMLALLQFDTHPIVMEAFRRRSVWSTLMRKETP
jgi:hypothetical protein